VGSYLNLITAVQLVPLRYKKVRMPKKSLLATHHKKTISKVSTRTASEPKGDRFGTFATSASGWLGSEWAFAGAILIIAIWAATGAMFHYSDTWQLIINTGTTIVTFLTVFLIQNTQNRDARAINLKLNELIYAIDAAGDQMMDIESLSDEELDRLQKKYEKIRAECIQRNGRAKNGKQASKNAQPI
jgi:low affinity Fe/Cu permease